MLLWWQWALMALAAFLSGVGKTGIAGLGILAVAMFASVLPARESVGTMLVLLLAGDVVAVWSYRRDAEWRYLWRIFPWAGAGVLIGAFAMGQIDDLQIRRLIGAVLIGLIVLYMARQWLTRNVPKSDGEQPAMAPWLVGATGILAGFTTMVANASGPVMILYLLALRLPKFVFMGTTAWFFLILNSFKVPFNIALDMITWNSLLTSVWLIPFSVVGALWGRWVLKVVDQQRFEQLALLLTLVATVRLML